MSKLEIFDSILNNQLKPLNQGIMVEENYDNFGRRFKMESKIVAGRTEHLLFRFDYEDIFPYFSSTSGLKKMCDYILFAEERQLLYVFLIELKLSRLSAKKQLIAGKAFARYIVETAKRIGHEIDDEDILIKSVRISNANQKKRKTRESFAQYNSDGYLDYEFQDFRLKYLMS